MKNTDINSNAEQKALSCKQIDCVSSVNLQKIKQELAHLLNHIGNNGVFAEYTMHDITHVNSMLNLVDIIIPDHTKQILTCSDWLMLVLAIYYHDLGMLLYDQEFENRDSNMEYNDFVVDYLKIDNNKDHVESLNIDEQNRFLYQEYVRAHHAERICQWILNVENPTNNIERILSKHIGGLDKEFRDCLALICKSHQEYELCEELQVVDKQFEQGEQSCVNLLYCSVILRVSDLLDITSIRTPQIEFEYKVPKNIKSQKEWGKQRGIKSIKPRVEVNNDGNKNKQIPKHVFEIQGKFTNPDYYFCFISYAEEAKKELMRCKQWCEQSQIRNANEYFFPWDDIDVSRVEAEHFKKEKFRFEIDKDSILKLLTGHTLYNNSEVVLRELAQNAIDANRCFLLQEKFDTKYQPKVVVRWDSNNRKISVSDNGTGMDADTIKNYLLKVGASKYQSNEFKTAFPTFHSISRFGIGILTCFMISDDIDIYTKDKKEKSIRQLKIRNLYGEYLLCDDADCTCLIDSCHGTTIELTVRPNVTMDNVEGILRKWIVAPESHFQVIVDGEEKKQIVHESIEKALTEYAKTRPGISIGLTHRVKYSEKDGVSMAFLQKYNKRNDTWQFCEFCVDSDDERIDEAPIGICVEGIKVTFYSPGFELKSIVALANCSGLDSPTTNVARDCFEGNNALTSMYSKIYEIYIDEFKQQLDKLTTSSSLIQALNDVRWSLNKFCRYYNSEIVFSKKEIFEKCFSSCDFYIIDQGTNYHSCSLTSIENAFSIDGVAYAAANQLIQDINVPSKTAVCLLNELQNRKPDESFNNVILLHPSSYMSDIFFNSFEVSVFNIDYQNRQLLIKWSKKSNRWKKHEIDNYAALYKYQNKINVFVPLKQSDIELVQQKNDFFALLSTFGIFLTPNSKMSLFLSQCIQDSNIDDNAINILLIYVSKIISDPAELDNKNFDFFFRSDINYLGDNIWDIINKEDFKSSLPNKELIVCDFDNHRIDNEELL